MDPKSRINSFLHSNRTRLGAASVDDLVPIVKSQVFYGMSPIPDDEIRSIILSWVIFNPRLGAPGATGSPAPPTNAAPPPSNSEFTDAIKRAVSPLVDGISVGKNGGEVNIAVTGATLSYKAGDKSVSLSRSWGGTIKLDARSGPFYFSGSVAEDKWEISLSFPEDTAVPNLSALGEVFTQGEQAVRNIVNAAASSSNLEELRRQGARIKPDVSAVQAAVEAASGIAKADKQGGMSFGVKLGSPDPAPGAPGMSPGWQVTGVVTWWF